MKLCYSLNGLDRNLTLLCLDGPLRVRMQYKQIAPVVRSPKLGRRIKAPEQLRDMRVLLITYAD